jgi:hypothetical protein
MSKQPNEHTQHMVNTMRFFKALYEQRKEERGDTYDKIAEAATLLAQGDGWDINIPKPYVARLCGQGDHYVVEATDFSYMRAYYILRVFGKTMGDLERAMERISDEAVTDEQLAVNAIRHIRYPEVRRAARNLVEDLAGLDASLPRPRTAPSYLEPLPGATQGAKPEPLPADGAPPKPVSADPLGDPLGDMAAQKFAEADQSEAERKAQKEAERKAELEQRKAELRDRKPSDSASDDATGTESPNGGQ